MRRAGFLGAALLAAASLPAQTSTMVCPPKYANVEASYSWSGGLGQASGKGTLQQIHSGLGTTPKLFFAITFRLDQGRICQADAMNLSLWLSNTTVTPYQIGSNYAGNHGQDVKPFLTQTTVNWPATPVASGPPQPFIYTLPFASTPFFYTGQGDFCWEARVHSRGVAEERRFDAIYTVIPAGTKFGFGCMASGNANCPTPDATFGCNAYAWAYIGMDRGGWNYRAYARHLGDNQPAVLMVGFDRGFWGGLPLPLDLGPFGLGAGVGTVNCHMNIAPVVAVTAVGFTTTLVSGTMSWRGWINYPLYATPWMIPFDPVLVGGNVYTQFFSWDDNPSARSLPLVFSVGVQNSFPNWDPLSMVYSNGDDTALSGTQGYATGAIIEVTYR